MRMLGWGLFVALVLLGAILYGVASSLYDRMLTRKGVTRHKEKGLRRKKTPEEEAVTRAWQARRDELTSCPHEDWTITAHDGLRLYARCIPARQKTDRWALCVHGYTASGPSEYAWFFDFYRRSGLNLLLPDNRAHGQSEGEAIGMGVLDSADVRLWAEELTRRTQGRCRLLLHGVSMGAATVMTVAGGEKRPEAIRGVIADCGYTSVWDEFSYQIREMFHLPAFPVLHLASLICRIRAGYGFKAFSPLDAVKQAKWPILFVHGGADDFVPTRMVHTLYEACTAPRKLLIVEGAPHAASYRTDPAAYERAATAFLEEIGMGEEQ